MEHTRPNANGLADARELLDELMALRTDVANGGREMLREWGLQDGDADNSLVNMANYIALRRHDLRSLQKHLTPYGLSSLGRLEGHVTLALDAVARTLSAIARPGELVELPGYAPVSEFFSGQHLIRDRARQIFGPPPSGSDVSIMVTLAQGEFATVEALTRLMQEGASVFRINGAHDGPDEWREATGNVHIAAQALDRRAFVLFDLAGPKIRTTGVIAPPTGDRLGVGGRIMLYDESPASRTAWPFQFQATVPHLARMLQPGNHVLIDDGKVDTVVTEVRTDGVVLEVIRARKKGERFRNDRGLNVPQAQLPVESLSGKDLLDLDFAVEAADIIGLSFVRQASDVTRLKAEIEHRRGERPSPGIIAKIESPEAFRQLPGIIVAGSGGPFGVMIARGDLAVEVGFERLAEVQEEMLWLCEAARVPVIWATQVLEGLAKEGTYSRAEVTDAAMGTRAECVMLNKGDHLPEAVAVLAELLRRMSGHQRKKSAQLRALRAW